MAGHSKWSNIKHRKQTNDLKKSKLFSKLANDIRLSASSSKIDVNSNFKLKKAVDKALSNNMSKDVINNIITNLDTTNQVKNIYSATGDNGISIIIECLDYNKNRIIGEIRYILNQYAMTLVPLKSIEYMYLKIDKFFLNDDYNDRLLFYYLDVFFLKDIFNNSIFLNTNLSKNLFSLLKSLDINFVVYKIFYPKHVVKLDFNNYNKLCKMISELEKLPYMANIFINF